MQRKGEKLINFSVFMRLDDQFFDPEKPIARLINDRRLETRKPALQLTHLLARRKIYRAKIVITLIGGPGSKWFRISTLFI